MAVHYGTTIAAPHAQSAGVGLWTLHRVELMERETLLVNKVNDSLGELMAFLSVSYIEERGQPPQDAKALVTFLLAFVTTAIEEHRLILVTRDEG